MPQAPSIPASEVATTGSDGEALARFIVSKRGNLTRKPITGPKALTKLHVRMIELMVHGIDRPLPHFPQIEPNAPLPIEVAAALCRIRLRHARDLSAFPIFQTELNRQIAQLRNGAKAKAMHVVVDELHSTGIKAADRKVRLEAADRILGDTIGTPRSANQVSVTINQAIEPGYIVRLPARTADDTKTIDHEPTP